MYFIARIDGTGRFSGCMYGGWKEGLFLVCMRYAAVVCVPGDWIKSEMERRKKNMQHACMCACACACFLSCNAVHCFCHVLRALSASQKGACALRIICTSYVVKKEKIELSDVTVLDLPRV